MKGILKSYFEYWCLYGISLFPDGSSTSNNLSTIFLLYSFHYQSYFVFLKKFLCFKHYKLSGHQTAEQYRHIKILLASELDTKSREN